MGVRLREGRGDGGKQRKTEGDRGRGADFGENKEGTNGLIDSDCGKLPSTSSGQGKLKIRK